MVRLKGGHKGDGKMVCSYVSPFEDWVKDLEEVSKFGGMRTAGHKMGSLRVFCQQIANQNMWK